jgi:glucosylceramidase
VDTATKDIFYTPLYYIMYHFSKFIRPNDKIVKTTVYPTTGLGDDFHATSALSANGTKITVEALNTTASAITYKIAVGSKNVAVIIPANSVQTVFISNIVLP